jgi:hypothetical protein
MKCKHKTNKQIRLQPCPSLVKQNFMYIGTGHID